MDIEEEPFENAQCIRDDPEFSKDFTDEPGMQIVKARKAVIATA